MLCQNIDHTAAADKNSDVRLIQLNFVYTDKDAKLRKVVRIQKEPGKPRDQPQRVG